MTRRLEYEPIDELAPASRNPKRHDLVALRASVARFGYVEPVVVDDRTGRLVAGHGRLEDLQALRGGGNQPPPGIEVDESGAWLVPVVRGWASRTDAEADAYLVASNRTTELGGWDSASLGELLGELSANEDLVGTGYDNDSLAALLESLAPPEVEPEAEPGSSGSLLALTDVSLAEPTHQVETGDVYRIGNHVLVVGDVMSDWPLWAPLLRSEALFVPYPGPYSALSAKAAERPLVLVQPDHYLAGHLLDKYESVRGPGSVVKAQ